MTSALHVYDAAIARASSNQPHQELAVEFADGSEHLVPYGDWCRGSIGGDQSVLSRCTDPTLDIGCGPGRIVSALARMGLPALGIDISAESMRQTRERGGTALRRSVFSRVPGERRWSTVLLIDGNIGIGGDPVGLLIRCAELIARDGRVIVELLHPHQPSRAGAARMRCGSAHSDWFLWAHLSAKDIAAEAALAGLGVACQWVSAGRWFVSLARVDGR